MEPDDIMWIPEQTTSEVISTQFLHPKIKIFLIDTKENVVWSQALFPSLVSGVQLVANNVSALPRSPFTLSVSMHSPPSGVTATSSWATGTVSPQVAECLGVSTDCLVQGLGSPVPLPGLGQPYGIMCTPVSPYWISARGCSKPGFLNFLSCTALTNHTHTDLHSGSDSKTVPPQCICKGQSLAEKVQIWELGEEKFLFCPVCTGSRENRESPSAVQFTDTSIKDAVSSVCVPQDIQCFKTSNS